MKIVLSATGTSMGAQTSPIFGRAPYLVLVDTGTLECEGITNPAASAGGGAGIQAAQLVIGRGAQAVVSANVGPNAFQVFQAAGILVYACPAGTVEGAVRAFNDGRLAPLGAATMAGHTATAPQAPESVESLESQAAALRAEIAALRQQINNSQ
ncbi:MAG: NifB/NifX family molybdenum-iron cluster-binding protein [Anaerolineae bacterium]